MAFSEASWEGNASETAIQDSTIWHDWPIQKPNWKKKENKKKNL